MAAPKKKKPAKQVAKKQVAKQRVAKQRVAKQRVAKQRVAKQRVAKQRVAKQRVAKQRVAPSMGFALVEADPASFPEDLRAHALELAPLLRDLRDLASRYPDDVRVGPPTSRDRVEALAKHHDVVLPLDYIALMMLADGLEVDDSVELRPIAKLMSAKRLPIVRGQNAMKAMLEQTMQDLADRGMT